MTMNRAPSRRATRAPHRRGNLAERCDAEDDAGQHRDGRREQQDMPIDRDRLNPRES